MRDIHRMDNAMDEMRTVNMVERQSEPESMQMKLCKPHCSESFKNI